MRIGIDARELCGHQTGVGRYLSGLLNEWSADERARGHEFLLYAPETPGIALDSRRFPTRLVAGRAGTWWEQVRMPAVASRDHLDVFFAPAYSGPLLRQVPTVVAIHDLSFAARPDWFAAREGARRRWFSRQSAQGARTVITISEFSRRELMERFGIAESSIRVIPPGIDAPSVPPGVTGQPARVLFVGSIFNRRHVPHLIKAFAPIARRHPAAALDIVGDNRTYPRQDLATAIAIEGLVGRVRWRPWVGDDELGTLYGEARAFAFLSEYEGLGLTPLEALAAGVPPLLLDTPVARESCGGAALYVSLNDLERTTRALDALVFDEQVRHRILAAAPEVLARYSWPRAARETLVVLEEAAGRTARVNVP
jgi:glycosyltransferase involved in cell wall biosynthesis